jgi:hypothetical protein
VRALVATLALTVSTAALACPACAGRDDWRTGRTFALLGSMILIPFGIAGAALYAVRRMDQSDTEESPR